jgi:hypothetical protein
VKGKSAGRKSLVAEWLASCMAQAFGLPVAPFRIAEVDERLLSLGTTEFDDLGEGYVFASRKAENVLEVSWSNLGRINEILKRDVLVFDWWVRNADRTLTHWGGNPNLLWDTRSKDLLVIDHNQAFDSDFDAS